MREFENVAVPAFFPQSCVGCQGQKGPMADTHREILGHGHVYICPSCAERSLRAVGLLDGEQRELLLDNTRELAQRDDEIRTLREQLEEAARLRREFEEKWEQTAAGLSDSKQRVEQLEQRLAEHARADLELLGAGVAGGADERVDEPHA